MKNYWRSFVLIAVIVALWSLCSALSLVPRFILPAPWEVASALVSDFPLLGKHCLITILESLAGFLIANVLAVTLAVLMLFVSGLDKAVLPVAIALKTTPIIAMAPLLLLWLGNNFPMKMTAAALVCFFPMLVNASTGLRSVGEGEVDLFRVYGASRIQILLQLRFPRALPNIFDALKVSSSLSIVGAMVAEIIAPDQGIGFLILVWSYRVETAKVLSAALLIAAWGFVIYDGFARAEASIVDWSVESEKRREASSSRNHVSLGL